MSPVSSIQNRQKTDTKVFQTQRKYVGPINQYVYVKKMQQKFPAKSTVVLKNCFDRLLKLQNVELRQLPANQGP